MPPLEDFDNPTLALLVGFGFFENTAEGPKGLDPLKVESWSRQSRIKMSPWQFDTVMEASKQYAIEASKKKDSRIPWDSGLDKAAATSLIRGAFRAAKHE